MPGRVAAGLGPVLVLAETSIEVGSGFPMHAHQGVEILSYVCTGRLAHSDTMGNGATLATGDVQVMRCGTGVRHSEVNDGDVPVRMYQMWLAARRPMVEPGYFDLPTPLDGGSSAPVAFASGRAKAECRAEIDVDATILGAALEPGMAMAHQLDPDRALYVVAGQGSVTVDDSVLKNGDAGLIMTPGKIAVQAVSDARVLIMDVAL